MVSGIWRSDLTDGPPLHNECNCLGADFVSILKNIKWNPIEVTLTTAVMVGMKSKSDPTENIHNSNDKMQIPFYEFTEVYDLLFVSTEQWSMKLYTFKKTKNPLLLLLFS